MRNNEYLPFPSQQSAQAFAEGGYKTNGMTPPRNLPRERMNSRRARIGMEPYVRQAPTKTAGQAMADMLGGLAIPTSVMPGVGDVTGLAADAAMYANYPEERTLGNAAWTLAGLIPFVPGAAAMRAGKEAAEGALDMSQAANKIAEDVPESFRLYHGTPHVIGPSQRVIDVETGKEYVESPDIISGIMSQNPGKYQVIGENPLGMFDLNRIGTGEGAQAFGEGIYGTQQPDIGRGYRDGLVARSGKDVIPMIGDRPATELYAQIEARASRLSPAAAAKEYDKLSLLEQAMLDNDVLGVLERKSDYSPEAFDWFQKNVAPKFSRPGALYEMEVRASPQSFLDWDAPVTEQPLMVREALERSGIYSPSLEEKAALLQNQKEILALDRDPITGSMINERQWHEASKELEQIRRRQPRNMTGQQAYYMAAPQATSQAAASSALRNLGIQGIQYLDQMSRGSGEGTKNFVLFDPKIAEITKKYGLAGAAITGSALRTLVPQEENPPL
jgi:hypothetical protein